MVVGTAGYMSPEQVRGEPVDARSDIFSVGTILYEMLTGRPAFARGTAAETMAAILKEDPPEPLPAERSAGARAHRRRAAWRRRARRGFQSARDLAFGLECLSGAPCRRRRPAQLASPAWLRQAPCHGPWPPRSRSALALALVRWAPWRTLGTAGTVAHQRRAGHGLR